MKSVIKKIIIFTLYYSGVNYLIGKSNSDKIFCLGYHSVWSDKNREDFYQDLYWSISISTEEFEKQIVFLKNNSHTFVHFSDLKNMEIKKISKPTIIFFDDGFRDVLVNALPILNKYNIPATIFLTTGLIDKKLFMWTMSVRYLLLKRGVNEQEIENKIAELKKISMKDRESLILEMFKDEKIVLNPANFSVFLNWEEIKDLSNNNFEIGSHGITHQKLTDFDNDNLRTELADSKKEIENNIGKTIEVLSYPYGRSDDKVRRSATSCGYIFGISGNRGYNRASDINNFPMEIKRMNADECKSQMDFQVKLYTNI